MENKSTASQSFWEKLSKIDARILYFLLVIAIAIPYLRPLGIPVIVSQEVRSFYDTVDQIPSGSVFLIDVASGPSAYGEIGPNLKAFMEYLTKIYPERHGGAKLKSLLISSGEEGPLMYDRYCKTAYESAGYTYGEDYVYFGFISGGETMVARLAENIPSLLTTDYQANNIASIPMMNGITDYSDIKCVVNIDSSSTWEFWTKQWASRGVKVGIIAVAVDYPRQITFYKSKDVFGLVCSSKGGAELEFLIGQPGIAIATYDTLSLSHLLLIVLILIGNIGFFVSRANAKKIGGDKNG